MAYERNDVLGPSWDMKQITYSHPLDCDVLLVAKGGLCLSLKAKGDPPRE
jgi:hypothetical protein